MNPEPEPRGDRRIPPSLFVAQAEARDPSEYVLLIDLLEKSEAMCFASAFRQLGWRVIWDQSGSFDAEAMLLQGPRTTLVITDDPSLRHRVVTGGLTPVPDFIVVIDDREAAYEGAYRAGAAWVVARPVDLNDPLGFRS